MTEDDFCEVLLDSKNAIWHDYWAMEYLEKCWCLNLHTGAGGLALNPRHVQYIIVANVKALYLSLHMKKLKMLWKTFIS